MYRLLVAVLSTVIIGGALAAPAGAKSKARHHGDLSVTKASFGALPELRIGTDPCDGFDGTVPLDGMVTDVALLRG